MSITPEEDERFKTAVKTSRNEVRAVEAYFRGRGYKTELAPERIRQNFEDRAEYGDDADLFVTVGSGKRVGIEVKGRTLNFTSVADFPYPTLFVDRVAKVERSTVGYYISVNEGHTHMAVIVASTKDQWVKREQYDSVKKHKLFVYECPKHLVKFVQLNVGSKL